jgi:hypothetical protein
MKPRAALVLAAAFSLGGCPGCRQELSTSEAAERSGPKADGAFSPAKVASVATTSVVPSPVGDFVASSNERRSTPLAARPLGDVGSAPGGSFGEASDPAFGHRPEPVGGSWVTCYGNYGTAPPSAT